MAHFLHLCAACLLRRCRNVVTQHRIVLHVRSRALHLVAPFALSSSARDLAIFWHCCLPPARSYQNAQFAVRVPSCGAQVCVHVPDAARDAGAVRGAAHDCAAQAAPTHPPLAGDGAHCGWRRYCWSVIRHFRQQQAASHGAAVPWHEAAELPRGVSWTYHVEAALSGASFPGKPDM